MHPPTTEPSLQAKTRSVWPTLQVKIACQKDRHEQVFSSQLLLTAHGMPAVLGFR